MTSDTFARESVTSIHTLQHPTIAPGILRRPVRTLPLTRCGGGGEWSWLRRFNINLTKSYSLGLTSFPGSQPHAYSHYFPRVTFWLIIRRHRSRNSFKTRRKRAWKRGYIRSRGARVTRDVATINEAALYCTKVSKTM